MTATQPTADPVSVPATSITPELPSLPQATLQAKSVPQARRTSAAEDSMCEPLLRAATAAGTFAEFCKALHSQGVSLGACSDREWKRPEIAVVKGWDITSLTDVGLHTEFASWMKQWDSRRYGSPLVLDDVRLVLARSTYSRLTGWRSDVPRVYWSEVKKLLSDVVAEDVENQIEDAVAGVVIPHVRPNSEPLAKLLASINGG